jgi:riboflavin synthase
MFTGIITNVARVIEHTDEAEDLRLRFERPQSWKDLALGESIATNGVCLTVAAMTDTTYDCVLVPETLEKSSFGSYIPERVNLERSLRLSDRLSGHFVQGHVDTTTKLKEIDQSDGYRLVLELPTGAQHLVVEKGSITLHGVSLTIASLDETSFSVALVPHTLQHTVLGDLKAGDEVNIEFDVLGKYIAKHMEER